MTHRLPSPNLRPLAFVVGLATVLGACAAAGDKASATGSTTPGALDATSATDFDTGASTASSPPEVVPSYYALHGTLSVARPDVVVDEIELVFYDASEAVVCTYQFTPGELLEVEAPDDEPLLTWWELPLAEPVTTDQPCATVPDDWSLFVGVGDYDARLDPAIVAAELDGADAYGLYLQETPDDPVWIAGLVATEAQLEGRVMPDADNLTDGVYTLRTLWLMPWTPR